MKKKELFELTKEEQTKLILNGDDPYLLKFTTNCTFSNA